MDTNFFAKALANSDNNIQAAFLNEFCRTLHIACRAREDSQLCYIADYLEPQAAEILSELVEFSKLAQEGRAKLTEDISKLRTEKWELEREVEKLRNIKEKEDSGIVPF